ncbi:hypothetical protein ACTHSJ_18960 [Paenibacillus cellulositrophicus]|uniref:hypothetical protein n=1 Tax=Paenibacillus cellulositrophicus TaxID=562959 RepID=UPI003F808482
MQWAEKIAQNMKSHDKYGEKVDLILNECLGELEDLGLAVNYQFLSLHPLQWKININNKEVLMTGDQVYELQTTYDENGFPLDHSRDTKAAVKEFLLMQYHETFK